MFLTETLAAIANRRRLALACFVFFDFEGQPMRLWDGTGDIEVGGHRWQGSGRLASISAITYPRNDGAGKVTFGLSGVTPEIVQAALSERSKIRGRLVQVYGQFLDTETLQPLDAMWTCPPSAPMAQIRGCEVRRVWASSQ